MVVAPREFGADQKPTVGTVIGWGYNSSGQTTVPSGLSNVVSVSGGSSHSLALKADGTVVAWGDNGYGQLNVPSGLINVVAAGVGSDHCLAVKADGTVVAWGDNRYGQTNVPSGLTNAVSVAAGAWHSLALKADGTVAAWGDNSSGQISVPADLTNAVAVAANGWNSLALKADGTVVAWGDKGYGEIIVPSGLSHIVAVAAGYYNGLALAGNGPPFIGSGFANRSAFAGGNVFFAGKATGAFPLSYQWQFNGANLPDATNAWLVLTNAQGSNAGSYTLVVSNSAGSATSPAAVLTVNIIQSTIENPASIARDRVLSLRVPAQAGMQYFLQYKDSLDQADWVDLPGVAGADGTTVLTDTNASGAHRFYRVKVTPSP